MIDASNPEHGHYACEQPDADAQAFAEFRNPARRLQFWRTAPLNPARSREVSGPCSDCDDDHSSEVGNASMNDPGQDQHDRESDQETHRSTAQLLPCFLSFDLHGAVCGIVREAATAVLRRKPLIRCAKDSCREIAFTLAT